MSQHDMTADNAGAATVRADLNSALQALASTSSGAAEPTTMYANQLWYDTSTSTLKKRNADNDAWISLLMADETNDQVSTLYVRTLIDALVDNTADIGSSSKAFKDLYMQGDLYFDNDNSRTQDHYCWVPISKATASASATLEFTLSSDYDEFIAVIDKIRPATDSQTLVGRVSTDGGSTYNTTTYGRAGYKSSPAGGLVHYNTTSTSTMGFISSLGNDDALHHVNGIIRLTNCNDATNNFRAISNLTGIGAAATNEFILQETAAYDRVGGAVDYIKFYFGSGNITSGTITLYGRTKI